MRLSRKAQRRLSSKRNKNKTRVNKKSLIYLTSSLTLLLSSPVYGATVDDLRELAGKERVDSKYTLEEQMDIIMQFNKIERHNRAAKLFEANDPKRINDEIEEEKDLLEQEINKHTKNLIDSFQTGAPASEVLQVRATLNNLLYKKSSLRTERDHITLELIENTFLEDYKNVIAMLDEVENRKDLGDMGYMLQSPVKDRFVLASPYGYKMNKSSGEYLPHYGLDLEGVGQDQIISVWGGVVKQVVELPTGQFVVDIENDTGLTTKYKYLEEVFVKEGDELNQYDKVGKLGVKKKGVNPYLYFEVTLDGSRINPIYFFGEKSARALNNFLMMTDDELFNNMQYQVEKIQNYTDHIISEQGEPLESTPLGKRDIEYNRDTEVIPPNNTPISIIEGYSMPKPTDEILDK